MDHKPLVQQPAAQVSPRARELPLPALAAIFVARTVLNAAFRAVYPFLPALADGLGLSIPVTAQLVNLRVIVGLGAPLLAPFSDHYGRRRVMELALLLLALAGLLLVGWPALVPAAVAFGLYGLAKVLYDPALHAYIGDTTPFERRGRIVGFVELSWSVGWLWGVPTSGFLIDRLGWKAPWGLFALLAVGSVLLMRRTLPPAFAHQHENASPSSVLSLIGRTLRPRHVRLILALAALMALAIEIPFIVYGAWLERTFSLSMTSLGVASVVIGMAEATAELGTTFITDRLGKRLSVLSGLSGMMATLVLLPLLPKWGLGATLAGLGLLMLAFEFGLVSLIPLISESVPDARATAVALSATAFSLGRFLGGALGGWLWQGEQIALHSVLAIICVGAAIALLAFNGEDRLRPPSAQGEEQGA